MQPLNQGLFKSLTSSPLQRKKIKAHLKHAGANFLFERSRKSAFFESSKNLFGSSFGPVFCVFILTLWMKILWCDHYQMNLKVRKHGPSLFQVFFQFSTFLEACLHGGGGPQVDEVTCGGGSTHRSCKRDQIKVRDYMDRRVTSPTWRPLPPCKLGH